MGEELLQRVGDRADGKRRLIDSDKTEGACMLVACLSEEYSEYSSWWILFLPPRG